MLACINIFKYIVYLFIIIFQSLFFVDYTKKVSCLDKVSKIKDKVGIISFILFNCLSYVFLFNIDQRISAVLFVISCLIYCMIFNLNNIVDNLISVFVFYSAIWTISYFCNALEENLDLSGVVWDYILTSINLAVMYFIITKIITRFIHFEKCDLYSNFEYVLLIFFSLIGFVTLIFYREKFSEIVAIICDIVIILFSYEFEIVRKNKKQNALLERQDKLLKETVSKKFESFKKSEEAEAEIRKLNHDLNHHFNYLLSCKDIKEMKDYINKLKGKANIVSKFYDTGNALFDMILEEKRADAEKAKIKFEAIGGFDGNELGIEPADASVILGNVLNNALEGAMKVNDDYKSIVTHFHQGPNEDTGEIEFYLKVQNTADTENLKLSPDGLIETSKEDKASHGIGLKSVKQIVQSYNGTMDIDIKPGKFIVEIHIPISTEK